MKIIYKTQKETNIGVMKLDHTPLGHNITPNKSDCLICKEI